jgi:hypothetical protein
MGAVVDSISGKVEDSTIACTRMTRVPSVRVFTEFSGYVSNNCEPGGRERVRPPLSSEGAHRNHQNEMLACSTGNGIERRVKSVSF